MADACKSECSATVDGLNQKFQLKTVEDERTVVEIVGDVSREALGDEIFDKGLR